MTGSIDLPAVYAFAIVFFWTPPHFWALALLLKDDYAAARVPMLPVVAGVRETKKAILLYTLLLLALTCMFFTTRAVAGRTWESPRRSDSGWYSRRSAC